MWVADDGASKAIDVFTAGSTGNVAPARRITGATTTMGRAIGIGTDSAGNAYAATYSNVLVFAAGANGNAAPMQTLSGASTGLSCPAQAVIK